MVSQSAPLIVAFIADLFFSSRIESTASRLGYRVEVIERINQISAGEGPADSGVDQESDFHNFLRAHLPDLLIFDLNNKAIPWEGWIRSLRADQVYTRLAVIAFGSHLEVDTMIKARDAGADAVLARSKFFSGLPDILKKHATPPH